MQAILVYLLKSIICCGILVAYYWLTLRNKQFHYYNRFYLLLSICISLIVPALNINWFSFESESDKAIALLNVLYLQQTLPNVTVSVNSGLNWQNIFWAAGVAVSVVMILLLVYRIAKIYRIKRRYPNTYMQEFDFINTDLQQAPFSFLNNLFWRDDLAIDDSTGMQIMQHEITHIKQKHTWDKLFTQIVLSICWMNPFFWLIRRELWLIHEFIADEQSVKDKDASAFAAMLLTQQYGSRIFSPAQPFNYSPIKRRLFMLTTSKEPRYSYARRLMSLPLLGLVVFLFAFRLHKKENIVILDQKLEKTYADDTTKGKTTKDTFTVKYLISVEPKKEQEAKVIMSKVAEPKPKPESYGKYKGKAIKDIFINQDRTQVILNLEDGPTTSLTIEEAKKEGINLPGSKLEEVVVVGKPIQLKEKQTVIKVGDTGAQPLIIVDGKPKEDGLVGLNPEDISSISVLKDENATAVYGEKGKNGVILIVTKKSNKDNKIGITIEKINVEVPPKENKKDSNR